MCLSNKLYTIKQKKKSPQSNFCRDEYLQSQLRIVDLTVTSDRSEKQAHEEDLEPSFKPQLQILGDSGNMQCFTFEIRLYEQFVSRLEEWRNILVNSGRGLKRLAFWSSWSCLLIYHKAFHCRLVEGIVCQKADIFLLNSWSSNILNSHEWYIFELRPQICEATMPFLLSLFTQRTLAFSFIIG